MENYDDFFEISEESVAAWFDGTLSPEEDRALSERISSDFQLAEILDAYEDIESDFEHLIEKGYELPSELSFDFQLPEIDYEADTDLVVPHYTSSLESFNYLETLESDSIEADNNETGEYFDDEEPQTDEFDFY